MPQRRGHGLFFVIDGALHLQLRLQRLQSLHDGRAHFGQHRFARVSEAGEHQPDTQRRECRNTDGGRVALCQSQYLRQRRTRHGIGDDFDGRQHLATDHRLEGRQRRHRQRFMHCIDGVEARVIEHHQTRRTRQQIGATGGGWGTARLFAAQDCRQLRSRVVFGHIVVLQLRHDHLLHASGLQGDHISFAQHPALFEHAVCQPQTVGEHTTGGVLCRHGAKLHVGLWRSA